MQIDKDTIVSYLRDKGDDQKAQEADKEMPDKVDHEQDSGLLERFGIDPKDLISKVGGGFNALGG